MCSVHRREESEHFFHRAGPRRGQTYGGRRKEGWMPAGWSGETSAGRDVCRERRERCGTGLVKLRLRYPPEARTPPEARDHGLRQATGLPAQHLPQRPYPTPQILSGKNRLPGEAPHRPGLKSNALHLLLLFYIFPRSRERINVCRDAWRSTRRGYLT